MKRLLSAVAAAGFLLAAAPVASAAPNDGGRVPVKPAPATQVWSTRVQSQQSETWVRLDVEQLSPRVVTAAGPDSVTVSGKVVNVSDRKVFDIELRLERGQPLDSEDAVRKALREPTDAEVVQPEFTSIAKELQPNETKQFSLTVPLKGDAPTSLDITKPGVYPILANINGQPDFGGRARLAALSTLLPVVAVPGGESVGVPAAPAKVTLIWPLADRPRLISESPAVLSDDELAGSLSLGGRLYTLLKAYESALDSPLAAGVCLAVDPDLIRTVDAMSKGYQVAGHEGRGRSEAKLWLDQLRLRTGGRCVIALPDADADLVALSRAKLGGLTGLALEGADVIREVLQVQPLANATWPEDGLVDQQTLADLSTRGVTSLVVDQSTVAGTPGTAPVRLGDQGGGDAGTPTTAVRVDGMVSDALRDTPVARPVAGLATAQQSQPVSVQNALAALTYRAGFQSTGQNVVIAPPRRWNAPAGEIVTFLDTAKFLVGGGYATATGLESLFAAAVPDQAATISYPADGGSREIPSTITGQVADSFHQLEQMAGAMSQQDAASAQPADLVDPLRLDLLRVVSGAWRGDESGAVSALALGTSQIDGLQSQVTVNEPNSPILLGSGDSPIPVTIKNRLDVRVTVRIVVEDTPGILAKQLPDQVLPARGDRLVTVPVEVLRSGRFSVHMRLTTPSGVELGDRARLEVSSSAYGTITLVITCLAGATLVLLSARRIYRRVRASRAVRAQVPNDASGVTPEKSSAS
ncbi:DUF6049 family protein [Actinosynnema sp. NPDC020468]|uniref:DUF6049 family protein n=1 Tax=Actinosynnema sp. NPDC020468 TaxID=3154488 RepID=UPI0033D55478